MPDKVIMSTRKDILKEYFIQYVKSNINLVGLFEFGVRAYPKDCRYDLMILNAQQQYFRAFEFKRTRSDFLQDLRSGKWVKYLDFCNSFTWVCPRGLIHPDEILSPMGLLWITDEQKVECYDHSYIWIKSEWKKLPRKLEISQEIFNKIVCLFIERIKFRKDDFY